MLRPSDTSLSVVSPHPLPPLCLASSNLLYPVRPGWSFFTYSLEIAAIRQRHTSSSPPPPQLPYPLPQHHSHLPPPTVPKQACPAVLHEPPVAVVPPGQRTLCVELTGRMHRPVSMQANSAL
ncbi:hypothetical protein D9C73_019896 [Collichthys lucidus]|uniref:Uncharacterized protein n=1 Tax=Collichthys lucidus TaxID=240159 RepID=A0A4U5VC02_COLLU|nr:hypothetical protein D9C73_019896 [Collichthys lucidus]